MRQWIIDEGGGGHWEETPQPYTATVVQKSVGDTPITQTEVRYSPNTVVYAAHAPAAPIAVTRVATEPVRPPVTQVPGSTGSVGWVGYDPNDPYKTGPVPGPVLPPKPEAEDKGYDVWGAWFDAWMPGEQNYWQDFVPFLERDSSGGTTPDFTPDVLDPALKLGAALSPLLLVGAAVLAFGYMKGKIL